MASSTVELDPKSPVGLKLQSAVEHQLKEYDYAADEGAVQFAEYIVVMLANGKTTDQITGELTDLIPDYNSSFTKWLFEEIDRITKPETQAADQGQTEMDIDQDESSISQPAHKRQNYEDSARRQVSDINNHLNRKKEPSTRRRSQSPPREGRFESTNIDAKPVGGPIRRGRGRGGRSGDSNAGGRYPHGPRGRLQQNKFQSMPNDKDNFMMIPTPFGQIPAAALWAMQMQMQHNPEMLMPEGYIPSPGQSLAMRMSNPATDKNSAVQKSLHPPAKPSYSNDASWKSSSGMKPKAAHPEYTLCKYGDGCTNSTCLFVHPTPAAQSGKGIVLEDAWCSDGSKCTNPDCLKAHPSPASGRENPISASPTTTIPCRNGAHCKRPDCYYLHPHQNAKCRYNPCLNALCPFSHTPGQQSIKTQSYDAKNKVWTPAMAEASTMNVATSVGNGPENT